VHSRAYEPQFAGATEKESIIKQEIAEEEADSFRDFRSLLSLLPPVESEKEKPRSPSLQEIEQEEAEEAEGFAVSSLRKRVDAFQSLWTAVRRRKRSSHILHRR
jgi:hypothetical protein